MCKCWHLEGDGEINTVLMITGHQPDCPNLKIDKESFCKNLHAEAQRIAEKMLIDEMPKLQAMYEKKEKKRNSITAQKIQVTLFHHLHQKGHRWIAPNIDIFSTGEMDVCSIMKSGLVNEYEIKISRADFKRDFKKEHKHPVIEKLLNGVSSETISIFGGQRTREYIYTAPNFFYFVVPTELVKVEELPDYAGLIYVNPEHAWDIRTIRKAKPIHKKPVSIEHKMNIADKLMWRCWTAKRKIEDI